jgi:hypothetical protein
MVPLGAAASDLAGTTLGAAPVASIFAPRGLGRPPRAVDNFSSDLLHEHSLERDTIKLLCLVALWLPSSSTGWLRMERPRPVAAAVAQATPVRGVFI